MSKLYFCIGTHASGKSSVAKRILQDEEEIIPFPEYKTQASVCKNIIVLGRYSKVTTAGGCDNINKKAMMLDMLNTLKYRREDIFMEGSMIPTRPWGKALMDMFSDRVLVLLHVYAPLEVCFQRIEERSGKKREELKAGGANIIAKYKLVESFKKWAAQHPQWKILTMDSTKLSPEQIYELL